jgi:hypothetical protein
MCGIQGRGTNLVSKKTEENEMSKKTCGCALTRAATQAKDGISCLFADLDENGDESYFEDVRKRCTIGALIWVVGMGAIWAVVHFARKWGLPW